jgi:protein-S-isoprenylcysteine O-methyltransferase Ste14
MAAAIESPYVSFVGSHVVTESQIHPDSQNSVWIWLLVASYVAFFCVSSWAHQRERKGAQGADRDRGSKPLIYLLSFAGAGGAFAMPGLVPAARIALPSDAIFAAAIGLMWSGILLYAWAIQTLGAFFRTSVTLLDGQKLITRGPYRVVRHPAYTGGILLFAGIGLSSGNWAGLAVSTLAVSLAYAWRIHVEEKALLERFGAEFEARRRNVSAVIPFIW